MSRGGLNKMMLIGRLAQDPEIKYTPQGVAVCSFTVATDESYKDKSGQMVNKTEWHKVVMWRYLAENAGKYLKKGSQVYIEGKLETRSWEKDGQKHYTTEIVASDMTFLGGKSDNVPKQSDDKSQGYDLPNMDFDDDSLPF